MPDSPLPLLKTRRNKMTTNRQQQMHSSCPSSSDEQISSPKQRQINRQQIKQQQQTHQHGLPFSTSLQLEQIKKEEPDFSEKGFKKYICIFILNLKHF